MKALVLAAGRSTRLDPIQDKNLLKFNGKPLVEWRLDALARAGITQMVVVVGAHNKDAITAICHDVPYEIDVVEQIKLDEGMAGAVTSSAKAIGDVPVLIVSTNDSVDQGLLDSIVQTIEKDDPDALVVGKRLINTSRVDTSRQIVRDS